MQLLLAATTKIPDTYAPGILMYLYKNKISKLITPIGHDVFVWDKVEFFLF